MKPEFLHTDLREYNVEFGSGFWKTPYLDPGFGKSFDLDLVNEKALIRIRFYGCVPDPV